MAYLLLSVYVNIPLVTLSITTSSLYISYPSTAGPGAVHTNTTVLYDTVLVLNTGGSGGLSPYIVTLNTVLSEVPTTLNTHILY